MAFYGNRGVCLLDTIMDGDCGPDTACEMLGLPRTYEQRCALRLEVSRYLLDRKDEQWMLDMLVSLQELDEDAVATLRLGGVSSEIVVTDDATAPAATTAVSSEPTEAPLPPPSSSPKLDVADDVADVPAVGSGGSKVVSDVADAVVKIDHAELVDALKWSTGLHDMGILSTLISSLPAWTKIDQVMNYRARPPVVTATPSSKVSVTPSLYSSRMKCAAALDEYIRFG